MASPWPQFGVWKLFLDYRKYNPKFSEFPCIVAPVKTIRVGVGAYKMFRVLMRMWHNLVLLSLELDVSNL